MATQASLLSMHTALAVTNTCGAALSLLLRTRIAKPKLFSRLMLIGPTPCFLNDLANYVGGFEHQDLEDLLSLLNRSYIGRANYLAPVVEGGNDQLGVSGEL